MADQLPVQRLSVEPEYACGSSLVSHHVAKRADDVVALDVGQPPATGAAGRGRGLAQATRRGQPRGPTNDQETEDFIYDALDLLPGASDVDVRCEGGRATFTGSVPHQRVKRDVGEIAWAIPTLNDVQNNITNAARRRSRTPGSEVETPAAAGVRKQA